MIQSQPNLQTVFCVVGEPIDVLCGTEDDLFLDILQIYSPSAPTISPNPINGLTLNTSPGSVASGIYCPVQISGTPIAAGIFKLDVFCQHYPEDSDFYHIYIVVSEPTKTGYIGEYFNHRFEPPVGIDGTDAVITLAVDGLETSNFEDAPSLLFFGNPTLAGSYWGLVSITNEETNEALKHYLISMLIVDGEAPLPTPPPTDDENDVLAPALKVKKGIDEICFSKNPIALQVNSSLNNKIRATIFLKNLLGFYESYIAQEKYITLYDGATYPFVNFSFNEIINGYLKKNVVREAVENDFFSPKALQLTTVNFYIKLALLNSANAIVQERTLLNKYAVYGYVDDEFYPRKEFFSKLFAEKGFVSLNGKTRKFIPGTSQVICYLFNEPTIVYPILKWVDSEGVTHTDHGAAINIPVIDPQYQLYKIPILFTEEMLSAEFFLAYNTSGTAPYSEKIYFIQPIESSSRLRQYIFRNGKGGFDVLITTGERESAKDVKKTEIDTYRSPFYTSMQPSKSEIFDDLSKTYKQFTGYLNQEEYFMLQYFIASDEIYLVTDNGDLVRISLKTNKAIYFKDDLDLEDSNFDFEYSLI